MSSCCIRHGSKREILVGLQQEISGLGKRVPALLHITQLSVMKDACTHNMAAHVDASLLTLKGRIRLQ